jgi:hypothetical protein
MTSPEGSPRSSADRIADWRHDFDRIYLDVQDIVVQRHLFREVMAIAAANPEVDELGGDVLEWIQKMHAHSGAVAIRKQIDRDRDSVSLRGLLETIAPFAHMLTREDYVSRGTPDLNPATERGRDELEVWRDDLDKRFDRLAGAGAKHVTEAAMREDLARLDSAAAQVRDFVRKTIVHRDRKWNISPPTWDELNGAIDTLDQLVGRYNELLDAGHASHLIPTWQYDWKAVFRIPWISTAASERPAARGPRALLDRVRAVGAGHRVRIVGAAREIHLVLVPLAAIGLAILAWRRMRRP